ncbi:Druantia anti-phage system protein DruA [Terrihalobacillus insolitus]|uniref:Druantia anti-phage system protein DruA n=1 Tax=Terrihalobacillus insolitus TaxID=2950438 RepID=UPI002FEE15DA
MSGSLSKIAPVRVLPIEKAGEKSLFNHLLDKYHYLGFHGTVGENMQYMAFDIYGRPLACLLFGSSAWRVAARDQWIGWQEEERKAHLHLTTNNTRFLIFHWVKVPQLASHLLGKVSRRLSTDWINK